DVDFPGGAYRRTTVHDGRCVFRARAGRGCALHAYSLSIGEDYHILKPLVSTLFPLSFSGDVLCVSDELTSDDDLIVCGGAGMTAYDALRGELEYYFGAPFVEALDAVRRDVMDAPVRGSLPVVG